MDRQTSRSARECARPSGLLDWYWYYFHSSLDSTLPCACIRIENGICILGANIGVDTLKLEEKKLPAGKQRKQDKNKG